MLIFSHGVAAIGLFGAASGAADSRSGYCGHQGRRLDDVEWSRRAGGGGLTRAAGKDLQQEVVIPSRPSTPGLDTAPQGFTSVDLVGLEQV
jgi:hypothetical protein